MVLLNIFPANLLTVLVSDESGKVPLQNATVMINGKDGERIAMGITNASGIYTVPLSKLGNLNDISAYVTYVGREEKTVSADGKNVIGVQLNPAPKEIGEVVITGNKRPKVNTPVTVKRKRNAAIIVVSSLAVAATAFFLIRKGLT